MVDIPLNEYFVKVVKTLEKNGFRDIVFAVSDPATQSDFCHSSGSVFWRRGVAEVIQDSCDEDTSDILEDEKPKGLGKSFFDRFSNQS